MMRFQAVSNCTTVPLLLLVLVTTSRSSADDFSVRTSFAAKLSASMNSVADGKSFRDGLTDLARQADLNLCIDRRVDPSHPIKAGNLGPTVMEAMVMIANGGNCVVMPLANVVLVGRAEWVDRTAAAIMSAQGSSPKSTVDVAWDDLTTPEAAVQTVLGAGTTVEPALPHDLWPQNRWKNIDQSVALALILAQFDRATAGPLPGKRNKRSIRTTQATAGERFRRRYSASDLSAKLRQTVSEIDRQAGVRSTGEWLEVTTSGAAHRAAVALLLKSAGQAEGPDLSTRFSLNAEAPAKQILASLAAAAGKQCRISKDAAAATDKIVQIKGTDVALKTLVSRVARQAGVVISWDKDAMVVSSGP